MDHILDAKDITEAGPYWMRRKGEQHWFIHYINAIDVKDMWKDQLYGFEFIQIPYPKV